MKGTWVLLAAMFAAGVYSVAVAEDQLVTFIFGDSLTEVGNNNYFQYSLAKSNFPWYGIDYANGKPTGRFTNGRTIGDILSAKMGVASPPAYLSLSYNDDAMLKGVNYASGGAGILNDTGSFFIQRLSFDDQIKYFEKTKSTIEAKVGKEAADKLCNQAIFFIGLGSNDYVNNYLLPFLNDGLQYTHDGFVGLLVSTLEKQLQTLYQLGARKVVFNGLGPIGCIPSQRVKSKTGQCLSQVNEWAVDFNMGVKSLLKSLNTKLNGTKFILVDTYPLVLDLIQSPQTYGFKVSNTSCCNVDSTLGGLCLPSSKICQDRSVYVFWDAFHPSDAANVAIADHLFSDPEFQRLLGNISHPTHAHAPAPAPAPIPSTTNRKLKLKP